MINSNIRNSIYTIELLRAWIYRYLKSRYRQSLLGGLWAILQPAASVAIFSVIFVYFVPVDTGDVPYALFSYAAMVPWTYFVASVTDMVDSLVSNMSLVTKIYFPREVVPMAATFSRLLDFSIASVLVMILMIINRVPFFLEGILFLPFIIGSQILLCMGIGLVGGALNVFYRDVRHIIALVMQVWFYATPIIYPVSTVPQKLVPFYFLNPMAGIIEAYRSVLFEQVFPGFHFLYSALVSFIVFIFGFWFFKRVEFQFADVV